MPLPDGEKRGWEVEREAASASDCTARPAAGREAEVDGQVRWGLWELSSSCFRRCFF